MEENKDLQGSSGQLPPEGIKLLISQMLTEKYGNYQAALIQLKTAVVSEDNIEEVQQYIRNVNSFTKSVDEHRSSMKEPYLNYGRIIDAAHKEFAAPFIEEKDKIQVKLNVAAKSKADRLEKERLQKEREQQIKTAINTFVLDSSLTIAAATTNEQLLSIERLINLEKTNKSKYGDLLPLLIERCNELNSLLKNQKDLVKQKEQLEKAKKEAEQSGDDDALNELEQKSAIIDNQIADKAAEVQSTASNAIIMSDADATDDVNAPKARRTAWKAEIFDEKEAVKKAKDMLDISLNAEKVRQSINTLKSAGVFIGKEEVIVNGIRYYQEKTF